MNGYKAFYKGKSIEVYADTVLEARRKAAEAFKVKANKAYRLAVVLCEKSGQVVTHSTADFG
ncbi:hypothetical protein LCGC14_2128350 [marine sediment metagenome]|uniref:Uncharacterized protein n=1 Tax=marine sediment metagenome TaxID=412755 RepID=A0A0F9E260_9ZZZZ